MSTMSWIRGVNGTLGWVAPQMVANRMRQVFMTPRETPPRDWELPLLASAERITLRFGLSALRWGRGPVFADARLGGAKADPVRQPDQRAGRAGYTAVALDGPAHGRSPGHEANVMLFARAMLEAVELPPLHAVIGHSMGGASAMLAVQLGLAHRASGEHRRSGADPQCAARFAKFVGMPARARSAFIRTIEQEVGIPAARLDVAHYQLDMPGLIVHAEDDTFVRVNQSELIHEAWFDSRLLRLEQGGHQRVLADPRVVEGVLALLAGRSLQARQSA